MSQHDSPCVRIVQLAAGDGGRSDRIECRPLEGDCEQDPITFPSHAWSAVVRAGVFSLGGYSSR